MLKLIILILADLIAPSGQSTALLSDQNDGSAIKGEVSQMKALGPGRKGRVHLSPAPQSPVYPYHTLHGLRIYLSQGGACLKSLLGILCLVRSKPSRILNSYLALKIFFPSSDSSSLVFYMPTDESALMMLSSV
jgi:hypothetical protein